MLKFESKGDFSKTNNFFEKLLEFGKVGILDKYGMEGVRALKEASPKDTGLMASSWDYEIEHGDGYSKITWINTDMEGGCNVAVLVQYGHAVKGGGYVQGVDFINPAMKPVFDKIAENAWKEVTGK